MSVIKRGGMPFDPGRGRKFKSKIKKAGSFIGKKVGLFNKSTPELEKEHEKTEKIVNDILNQLSPEDREVVGKVHRDTKKNVEKGKNTLRNLSKKGSKDHQIYRTAQDVFNFAKWQGEIAQELNSRGTSIYTATPFGTSSSRSSAMDEEVGSSSDIGEIMGVSLPDLDEVEVSERIGKYIDSLFNGYQEEGIVRADKPLPEGTETKTITDKHGVEKETYIRQVGKEEVQDDFRLCILFLKGKEDESLTEMAKVFRDKYDPDSKENEVIELLNDLSQASPKAALAALRDIQKRAKTPSQKKKIAQVIQEIKSAEAEAKETFQLKDDKGGISPQKFSETVLDSKKSDYKKEVQKFAELLVHNDLVKFRFGELESKDILSESSEFSKDIAFLNTFIHEAITSQPNQKKAMKMYGFFLDVANALEEKEVEGRKGDFHGMQSVLAPLSATALTRMADRGKKYLTKKQRSYLKKQSKTGLLNPSSSSRLSNAREARQKGIVPNMVYEMKDAFLAYDNYGNNKRTDPLALNNLFFVMGNKMREYYTLRDDLSTVDLPEPEMRLSGEGTHNEEFYYQRSLKLFPRK